jgi:hypothetical protein
MKPQHVAYLTSSEVVLYTWDQQQYVPVSGYELPDGDPTPLVSYLRQTPATVVAILADVLEEEHNQDTIARLGRSDQSAMLARKLARAFPRTAYRTAAVQGRRASDPQTTRILLSGLTKADHLRTLQGLLGEAKLPVSTVCSPALLSRPLLEKLRPANPADATLLVSRQREGSLRLSFFRGRDLVGSRLIRRSLAAVPGDIPRLVRQLEESVRYFDAAFAPSASNPVDVLLLCETGVSPAEATARGTGHEGFRLHVPDPVAAAKKLGLGTGPDSGLQPGNADLLFVELLRRYAPAGNFAPPEDRRYFHLHQVRVFGRAASVAVAVAGLVGASLNGVTLLEARLQMQDVRTLVAELTQRLQADASNVDGDGDVGDNGVDPLGMQQAVTAWRELTRRGVKPEAVLALVSAALERQSRVQLDSVQWSPVTATLEVSEESTETGVDETATEDSAALPDEAVDSGAGTTPRVRVSIRGRVEPFSGDYQQAFAELGTFIDSLRADPRVLSVTARKQPLDVNPRSTLTGEMNPALRNDEATFTVDLLVRLADEPA